MSTSKKPVAALTGATGFLGSHLLDALVDAGYRVKALTRHSQPSRQGVEWVKGELSDVASLAAICKNAKVVIHAAGVVKAQNRTEFFKVNRDGTERVLKATRDADVKKFIFVSSLAAREPQLSHYAASKSVAEDIVLKRDWDFKRLVIRPPAIYGPKDMEILEFIKATKYGVLPAPGSRNNRFSMINGVDLAAAIVTAAKARSFGAKRPREIDDGFEGGYTAENVAETIAMITGEKRPKIIPLPRIVLKTVGAANLLLSKVTGKIPMLTPTKANELAHPDWVVNEKLRITPKDWSPTYDLASGLKMTIEWYRDQDLM